MSENLTSNTKAILLLTAPLVASRNGESADILKPSEYRKLAIRLREIGAQPADLLATENGSLLEECRGEVDAGRLRRLLERGFLLSQAYERWQSRAIWVVSRADSAYPQRLKSRLKEDSPSVLYGCGEPSLLDAGGLAVVGSREADPMLLDFAREAGRLAALARQPVVSGGARGIDQAAMRGALDNGGRAIGVVADSLEKTAMNRENRNLLLEGQLALVSPYDPGAGFNVGHAMQRNKLIYALADAALVVSAEYEKGGTWAGATEQLDKLRFVPIYVRAADATSRTLTALVRKGAQVWPNPRGPEELDAVLAKGATGSSGGSVQPELPLISGNAVKGADEVREVPKPEAAPAPAAEIAAMVPESAPAEALLVAVRALVVRMLAKPLTSAEVAAALGVSKAQADTWLKRFVAEGVLEKKSKPLRYAVKQVDLFRGSPARD